MEQIISFLPNWLSITLMVLILIAFVWAFVFFFVRKPLYYKYNNDNFYDIHWKWFWKKDKITELFCFCPTCDESLVYDDSSCNNSSHNKQTKFICEKCHFSGSISGGNISYSLNIVEREINRKVRLNEFELSH